MIKPSLKVGFRTSIIFNILEIRIKKSEIWAVPYFLELEKYPAL